MRRHLNGGGSAFQRLKKKTFQPASAARAHQAIGHKIENVDEVGPQTKKAEGSQNKHLYRDEVEVDRHACGGKTRGQALSFWEISVLWRSEGSEQKEQEEEHGPDASNGNTQNFGKAAGFDDIAIEETIDTADAGRILDSTFESGMLDEQVEAEAYTG